MNSVTSMVSSRHGMEDVNEILELYERELHVSFDSYFSSGGIMVYCHTLHGGDCPSVLIPYDANFDQSTQKIFELLEEINVDFNTSLSKLKMKRDIRGD